MRIMLAQEGWVISKQVSLQTSVACPPNTTCQTMEKAVAITGNTTETVPFTNEMIDDMHKIAGRLKRPWIFRLADVAIT